MKCNQCGYEEAPSFNFCPKCGCAVGALAPTPTESPFVTPRSANEVEQKVLNAVKSPLFIVIAILLTAYTGFGIFGGGFSPITILATIFSWIVYASATKNVCDVKNLRVLSGVTFASYVVGLVLSIICAVVGILIAVFGGAIAGDAKLLNYILENATVNGENIKYFLENFEIALPLFLIVFGIMFVIISVPAVLVSVFGVKTIHSFVKSVYKSAESGKLELKKKRAAEGWLMVFGVLTAISAILSLVAELNLINFILNSMISALYICLSVFIKKKFS